MKCATFKNSILITSLLVMAACTSSKPPLEYIGPNMVKGPSLKAQRADCYMFKDSNDPHCIRGPRMPVEGTIPTNFEPYPYPNDAEAAGRLLKNPLRPTKAILERGQILFDTYCAVCHGNTGDGNGYIVPKFPQPPTLASDKVTNWTDGRIFHVITMGQNLMPSYASQVTADERWAIINYVRVLQRAAHPSAADLKAVGK